MNDPLQTNPPQIPTPPMPGNYQQPGGIAPQANTPQMPGQNPVSAPINHSPQFPAHQQYPQIIDHPDQDLLHNVLQEHQDIYVDTKTSFLKKLVQGIIRFEERHPWLFFFITAIIIFLIVVAVISLFVGKSSDNNSNENVIEPEIVEEIIPPTNTIVGSVQGARFGSILADRDTFDALVYQGETNTYLGIYFERSQKLDQLLQRNIQIEIQEANNKEELLDNYYRELQALYTISVADFDIIQDILRQNEVEEKTLNNAVKILKEDIANSFQAGTRNKLLQDTKKHYETLELLSDNKNKKIVADILYGAYKSRLPQAEARLTDIEINREAILQNIKITPIRGSGIDFTGDNNESIETQAVEDVKNSKSNDSSPLNINIPSTNRNSNLLDNEDNIFQESIKNLFPQN